MEIIFEKIKNAFRLPATIVMMFLIVSYAIYKMIRNNSKSSFFVWEVENEHDSDKVVVEFLAFIAPYEYAFSTIVWILTIKYIF